MRRGRSIHRPALVMGLLLFLSETAGVAGADPVEHTLPNGVRVVVDRRPQHKRVAVRAVWPQGSMNEPKGLAGVSHLLANTLTLGCGARNTKQVRLRADALGGSLAGVSGASTVAVRGEWLKDKWRDGLALVADCALRPRFDAHSFARAHARHGQVLRQHGLDAAPRAVGLMLATLFGSNPASRDPAGSLATHHRLTRRRVAAHFRGAYGARGLTVVVVGNVDPARVVSEAGSVFAQAVHVSVPPAQGNRGNGATPSTTRQVFAYGAYSHTELVIGFPGTSISHADATALALLAEVLGGPKGVLTRAARTTGGLVYPVRVRSVAGHGPGYLAIHATTHPHAASRVHASLVSSLKSLAGAKLEAAAVSRARAKLASLQAAARGSASASAAALGFHVVHKLNLARYLDYPTRLAKLTSADVTRVAASYLKWSLAVTATVMPQRLTPAAMRRARGVRKRLPRRRRRRR